MRKARDVPMCVCIFIAFYCEYSTSYENNYNPYKVNVNSLRFLNEQTNVFFTFQSAQQHHVT